MSNTNDAFDDFFDESIEDDEDMTCRIEQDLDLVVEGLVSMEEKLVTV